MTLKRQVPREKAQELLKRYEQLRAEKGTSLNGLYLEEDQLRVYPMGTFLTQVLGLTTIDGVGQSGLEKQLDKYLRGKDGLIVNEVDGKGNEMPYSVSEYTPPVDGGSVTLTIDAAIQGFAEKAMRECYEVNSAAAVQALVMDVNTGEILAMVSKPDFDPNAPPRDDVETLTSRMRIRSISDVYEPGSTFKILTAAAALETGVTNPSRGLLLLGQRHGGRLQNTLLGQPARRGVYGRGHTEFVQPGVCRTGTETGHVAAVLVSGRVRPGQKDRR